MNTNRLFSEDQRGIYATVGELLKQAAGVKAALESASLKLELAESHAIARRVKGCRKDFLRFLSTAQQAVVYSNTIDTVLIHAQKLQAPNPSQNDVTTLRSACVRVRRTIQETRFELNLPAIADITRDIQTEVEVRSTSAREVVERAFDTVTNRRTAYEKAEQALRDGIPSLLKAFGINEKSSPRLLYGSLAPVAFFKTAFGRRDPVEKIAHLERQFQEEKYRAEDAERGLSYIKEDQKENTAQLRLEEALSSLNGVQENANRLCMQLEVFNRIPLQVTADTNEILYGFSNLGSGPDPAATAKLNTFVEYYTQLNKLINKFCIL